MTHEHTPPWNRIPKNSLLVIDGVDKIHRGYTGAGRHDIADAVTGMPFVMAGEDGIVGLIDDVQFADLLESERFDFRPVSKTERVRLASTVSRYTLQQAMAIDPDALRKLVVCEKLDAIGCKNGTKATDLGLRRIYTSAMEAQFGPMPSAHTVRRWRSQRGRPGMRHARDMVSMSGLAKRRSSLAEPVEETIQKHALDKVASNSSIRAGYSLFVAEVQRINDGEHPVHAAPTTPYPIPAKRTYRRRCDALQQSATMEAGISKAAVVRSYEGGGRTLTADYAMHRVIIDHTWLDVHAVSSDLQMVLGRPWLTIAIDVFTRAVVGWVLTFIDPCGWTVAEVLRRVSLPKRPPAMYQARYPILRNIRGKPTEIVLDNAGEFTSHSLEAAIRATGSSVRWCPIRKARYRAVGERIHDTINTWISEELPGKALSIAEARSLGYVAEDFACVMMEEIEADLNGLFAEYHISPHGGLQERQPALVFEKEAKRRGIDVWSDFEGFRLDTLPGEDNAQLSQGGIRAFNLRYAGKREVVELLDDLIPVEGRRQRRDRSTATVSFRYDPLDISRIHVWNRVKRIYVTLKCTDDRYSDGMPQAFHDQLVDQAAKEGAAFNTELDRELFRAKRIHAIRKIKPSASAVQRKIVADLYEAPRIRQITGNIVDLRIEPAEAVSIGDFIAHDRAALTNFDVEVRAGRPAGSKRPPTALEERRRALEEQGRHDDGDDDPDDAARAPIPEPRRCRGGGAPA